MGQRQITQHLRSNVIGNKPSPVSICEGEIAVNYAKGSESLIIKNTNGEIIEFNGKVYNWIVNDKLKQGTITQDEYNHIFNAEIVKINDVVFNKKIENEGGQQYIFLNCFLGLNIFVYLIYPDTLTFTMTEIDNTPLSNIQAVETTDILEDVETNTYVKYVAQSLTDGQKQQVRDNIGITTYLNDLDSRLNEISTKLENLLNK